METAIKIRKDLTGRQFGQLTVLYLSDRKVKGSYYYCCQCECGKIKDILRGSLTSGKAKSCGCLQKEKATTHGYYKHLLYGTYEDMKSRCYNPKRKNYHNYGGRGITVCDEWLNNPALFIQWGEENGYKKGLQLDRINNEGNYSPKNCRFVTNQENSLNRRDTVYVLLNGEKTLGVDAAIKLGIDKDTVSRWNRQKRVSKNFKDIVTLIED